LVITDLFMPTQDGVETIREFRSRWPEVAIIARSGNATARNTEGRRRVEEAGTRLFR
jgi:DNA-binding NarL/FixJ family response regulator